MEMRNNTRVILSLVAMVFACGGEDPAPKDVSVPVDALAPVDVVAPADTTIPTPDLSEDVQEADSTPSDDLPPSWPEAAELTVTEVEPTSLVASWPEAIDDVGVEHYTLTIDGIEVVTVDGNQTSVEISELNPGLTYLVGVRAFDLAGIRPCGPSTRPCQKAIF